MTPEQFAYWLQGFSEITGSSAPTAEQWKVIQDHLNTVFVKITPSAVEPFPQTWFIPQTLTPSAPAVWPQYPQPQLTPDFNDSLWAPKIYC